MPNVRLALSGLREDVAVVAPLMSEIAGAFQPFGINLLTEQGIELPKDPEETTGAWANLVTALEQKSQMTTPAHLVITTAPPAFDRTINGMLLDTAVRGVAAVYLGADIYGFSGAGATYRSGHASLYP